MRVPGRPCLMFAAKAGAYLSEPTFRCSFLALTHKLYARLESLARDERSSLLGTLINHFSVQYFKLFKSESLIASFAIVRHFEPCLKFSGKARVE